MTKDQAWLMFVIGLVAFDKHAAAFISTIFWTAEVAIQIFRDDKRH